MICKCAWLFCIVLMRTEFIWINLHTSTNMNHFWKNMLLLGRMNLCSSRKGSLWCKGLTWWKLTLHILQHKTDIHQWIKFSWFDNNIRGESSGPSASVLPSMHSGSVCFRELNNIMREMTTSHDNKVSINHSYRPAGDVRESGRTHVGIKGKSGMDWFSCWIL